VKAPAEGPRRSLATDDEDVTCLYQWPVGATLATRLSELVVCTNQRVVDLGCGLGTLGLTALGLGAREVLFADASVIAIDLLQRTLAENDLQSRAHAVRHDWGEPLPNSPWPVILGGDILYRPDYFPQLLHSIAVSLSHDGCALLSDPRTVLDQQLLRLATKHGLVWNTSRDDGITIVTLRHR
jgi:ribosomal protein L11 methylase PrmA